MLNNHLRFLVAVALIAPSSAVAVAGVTRQIREEVYASRRRLSRQARALSS